LIRDQVLIEVHQNLYVEIIIDIIHRQSSLYFQMHQTWSENSFYQAFTPLN